jgi:hypothetical protein
MARVGILTFHYANNYGAVLQAYGLSQAIAAMGHSVEIIDYRPLAARRAYGRWPRDPRKVVPSAVLRWRSYRFRRCYLPLSQRPYLAPEELRIYPPKVEFVICGSDQVWNTASYRGFDPTFFLQFLDGALTRRVSYAATFGYADDLGTHRQEISTLLSRFDHLSVRDVRSQDMVRALTGRTAEHVLDPSMLTDYGPITPARMVNGPYVVVYCLSNNELFKAAVRTVQRRLGMPVVSINMPFKDARVLRSGGPLQWLSLMQHADFVCTNSFHGVCFSLKNRKEFLVLPTHRGQSRLEDILRTAGLSDRLVHSQEELDEAMQCAVDYGTAATRLTEAGDRSVEFLREALR